MGHERLEPREHDPHSEYDLHDVADGTLLDDMPEDFDHHNPQIPSTEYGGFHLMPQPGGSVIHVQPDGYAGGPWVINPDDFDDVLQLAYRLSCLEILFWVEMDEDERAETAGPVMTSDKERAEGDKTYLYVPDE